MAKHLNNIDLDNNQLQNAVIHPLGTAPSNPSDGQLYYNSTIGIKKIYLYDSEITDWKSIAGDITGVRSLSTGQLTIANPNGEVPDFTIVTGAVTNGGSALATGDQIYDFVAENIYNKWNLKTNGSQRLGITKNVDVDFVGQGNVTVGYNAGGVVTFNSVNSYTNAATFDSNTGIVSFSGLGGQPDYTVDLDGRYATGSGSGSYIQNQNTEDQVANLRINGTGQFGALKVSDGNEITLGGNSIDFSRSGANYIQANESFGDIIFISRGSESFKIDTGIRLSKELTSTSSATFGSSISATDGYFSKDIIGDGSAYLKKIWGGSNGGIVELKTDPNTVNRYSRIGISDINGNWTGGLTILDNKNGIFDNAMETKLGIFRNSGSVNTPLTVIQAFNTIPYNTGNGRGEAVIEIGHNTMHGYIQSGSYVETDSSRGYMSFGHKATGNVRKEAFRISDDTRILINTGVSNGIDQLQVNGSGHFSSNLTTEGTVLVNAGYDIGFALLGGFKISRQNGYTRFDQNSSEVFRLNSNLSTEFVSSISATNGIFSGYLDVGTDVVNSVINMKGSGDSFIEKDVGGDLFFANNVTNKDILFRLNDNGNNVNALLLDGSNGGAATFASDVYINGNTQLYNNLLKFDESGVRSWSVYTSGGNLNFDAGDSQGNFVFNTTVSSSVVPTEDYHLANVAYVDGKVLGSGVYQNKGDYNAETNSPKLDSDGSDDVISGIKNGHTYKVVGTGGTFYSEEGGGVKLTAGDVLTANRDNPSQISHWTIVQGNIDFATYTSAGIASFSSDNFSVGAQGQVAIKDGGITLGTETSGAYVAELSTGLGLNNTTANIASSTPVITLALAELGEETPTPQFSLVGANETSQNKKFTIQSILDLGKETLSITGNGSTTTFTKNHNLGFNVLAQVFDNNSGSVEYGDTVVVDTKRTSTSVTFTFAKAPSSGVKYVAVIK